MIQIKKPETILSAHLIWKLLFGGFVLAISSGLIAQEVKVIDIEAYRKIQSQPKLSEIASDTWFIKLETNSSSLIGKINSVKLVKNKILVQSGFSRLLLFNINGSFHGQVGRKGKGPGEYTQVFATAVMLIIFI